MHKLLLKIFVGAGILLIFNPFAFATGPASVYKVRVSKFELNNGTSWITVFTGTSDALDIASVSSGASAGSFLSGLSVPDGTYTQVRVTPSPTFVISGRDDGTAPTTYTTATAGNGGGSAPTTVASQQAEFTLTLTGGNVPGASTTDFSATPITVKDGVANRKIRVSFDVSNAIDTQGGALWPAQPTVTMSAQ